MRRTLSLIAAGAILAAPFAGAMSAQAVGGSCDKGVVVKVPITAQPDQYKVRGTCTTLQSDSKFKAIMTSKTFPNAVSSWRTTAGSVETGTRVKVVGDTIGSDLQIAAK